MGSLCLPLVLGGSSGSPSGELVADIVHSGRGHRGTLLSAFEASCLQPLGSNPGLLSQCPHERRKEGNSITSTLSLHSVSRQRSAVTGAGSVIHEWDQRRQVDFPARRFWTPNVPRNGLGQGAVGVREWRGGEDWERLCHYSSSARSQQFLEIVSNLSSIFLLIASMVVNPWPLRG